MPLFIDFPDKFRRTERPAQGAVDELRWFSSERAGLDGDDVPPGAPLIVRGWLLDVDGRSSAHAVIVRVDDSRHYEARSGKSRPDVASALENPAAIQSGFEAIVPTALLAPGQHEMSFFAVDYGSMTYAELASRRAFYVLPADRSLPVDTKFGDGACAAQIDEIRDVSFNRQIDPLTGSIGVPRGSLVVIRGWAYDEGAALPVSAVFALVDGRSAFEAVYGVDRPDVATAFERAELAPVGFSLEIPTIELERGLHLLEIIALGAAGELLRSSVRLDLVVRDRTGRASNAAETTPAFVDSVVRVAADRERERMTPFRAERGDDLFIRGWAIDGTLGTVGAGVVVVVDDEVEIAALYGLPRPDIADAFGNPALARCGFTAEIPTAHLTLGRHSARCYVVAGDGRGTLSTAQQFEFEVDEANSTSIMRR